MSGYSSGAKYASVDIGSHTLRLSVAEIIGDRVHPVLTERRITRLASGFSISGDLAPERVRQSLEVLAEYAEICSTHRVRAVSAGATGVMRRADGAGSFLSEAARLIGTEIEILSESTEALLSAKGVLSVLPPGSPLVLTFDVGGSSTELTFIDTGSSEPVLWSTSVFTGAATISERFLKADPPGSEAVAQASSSIKETLMPGISEFKTHLEGITETRDPGVLVAGTAGTITTLAAMFLKMENYEPAKINGLTLPFDWIERIVSLLTDMPLSERRQIIGLEKGREDIILGGALIVREIYAGLGKSEVTVTDCGLLEGILLDLVDQSQGRPRSLKTPLSWCSGRE